MLLLPSRLSWASAAGATRNPPTPSKRATSHLHTCGVIYKFDPISPQIPSACCGGGDAGCPPHPTPPPHSFLSPLHHTAEGSRMTRAVQSGAWAAGAEGGRAPAREVQICCSPGARSHSRKLPQWLSWVRDAEAWAPHSKAEGALLAVTGTMPGGPGARAVSAELPQAQWRRCLGAGEDESGGHRKLI